MGRSMRPPPDKEKKNMIFSKQNKLNIIMLATLNFIYKGTIDASCRTISLKLQNTIENAKSFLSKSSQIKTEEINNFNASIDEIEAAYRDYNTSQRETIIRLLGGASLLKEMNIGANQDENNLAKIIPALKTLADIIAPSEENRLSIIKNLIETKKYLSLKLCMQTENFFAEIDPKQLISIIIDYINETKHRHDCIAVAQYVITSIHENLSLDQKEVFVTTAKTIISNAASDAKKERLYNAFICLNKKRKKEFPERKDPSKRQKK